MTIEAAQGGQRVAVHQPMNGGGVRGDGDAASRGVPDAARESAEKASACGWRDRRSIVATARSALQRADGAAGASASDAIESDNARSGRIRSAATMPISSIATDPMNGTVQLPVWSTR